MYGTLFVFGIFLKTLFLSPSAADLKLHLDLEIEEPSALRISLNPRSFSFLIPGRVEM